MIIGLDFGTTNTVLAAPTPEGRARLIQIPFAEGMLDTIRSALGFWRSHAGVSSAINVEAGPFAIKHYIERPDETRFIQSMKTFAASHVFQGTHIHGKRYDFENLLYSFLARVFEHAGLTIPRTGARIVVGRPVAFAGSSPDADLAMSRYANVFRRLGFSEVAFVYEPVAAAFFFAESLRQSATILVADFGGGTTDFSTMRFERDKGRIKAIPLGQGGVGIAGDQFDYRIINAVISPKLGKGTQYRGMGKTLDLPDSLFASFSRWNTLSVMKTSKEFRDLKALLSRCVDPKKIELFIDMIEEDQGYPLYQAVSRAKAALSFEETSTVDYPFLGAGEDFTIRRQDFETWIADDLARIERALQETLAKSNLAEGDIDQVFLTGGTSFVPAVRQLFERRFGQGKIRSGNELVSIANGLALIGARDDYRQWTWDGATPAAAAMPPA